MNTELKVNVGSDTLTVLQGNALPLKEPQKISLAGNIDAPADYLKQRYVDGMKGKGFQQVDKEKALVEVDKDSNTLTLKLDPENFYGPVITGKLEDSTELKKYCINQGTEFTREELIKLFRMNKVDFNDTAKAEDLVRAFQKFSVKGYVDLVKEDDTRGNFKSSIEKRVETGLPEYFVLNVPIYKGQPEKAFRVDICLELTGSSVSFWFESTELAELRVTHKDEIFTKQLEACKDFPIIHK